MGATNVCKDIMIDLETLGTRTGCIILSLGAVEFNRHGLHRQFYTVFSTAEQRELGLHEDPATVAWWAKQSAAARTVLNAEQQPLEKALLDFSMFCAGAAGDKQLRVWGNGANFDNPILTELYRAAGKPLPWKFWNDCCYRTLKKFADFKAPAQGVAHNALDDAVKQAQHLVKILSVLGLWENLESAA